jgi:hypothetical protein
MTDDDLWTQLRAGVVTADLDPGASDAIQRRAHARLRNPHRALSTSVRAVESIAVIVVVLAQLAWAWSVVLG